MKHTKVRSWSAIAFGIACIIGTVIVLFGHVRSIRDLTISHLYISLALIVALGAAHFMWEAFEDGWSGVFIGVSFTLLFILSTIVCVGFSAGRSADMIDQRERLAEETNTQRSNADKAVKEAEKRYEQLRTHSNEARERATASTSAAAEECTTGKGKRCDGSKDSATLLDVQAKNAEKETKDALVEVFKRRQEASKLGHVEVANGDLRHIAKLYALFSGKTEDQAFIELKMILPYVLALLTEFGGIVFLKYGRSPVPIKPAPIAPSMVTLKEIAEEMGAEERACRKILRSAGEQRTDLGWAWNSADVHRIKSTLSAQIAPTSSMH